MQASLTGADATHKVSGKIQERVTVYTRVKVMPSLSTQLTLLENMQQQNHRVGPGVITMQASPMHTLIFTPIKLKIPGARHRL